MEWLHEPADWEVEGDTITVRAEPGTDIWREPGEGGIRDNGHCYLQTVRGDFTAEVKVRGQYANLYDQAGLMVRLSGTCWMKCGIEFVDGIQYASAVVTREWSDWSILELPDPDAAWFRVIRTGAVLRVLYSLDGLSYTMFRKAYITDHPSLSVGIMAASPKHAGFSAQFDGFRVIPG